HARDPSVPARRGNPEAPDPPACRSDPEAPGPRPAAAIPGPRARPIARKAIVTEWRRRVPDTCQRRLTAPVRFVRYFSDGKWLPIPALRIALDLTRYAELAARLVNT